MIRLQILLGVILALFAGNVAAQQPDMVTRQDGRSVQVKVYAPPVSDICLGIAIISPGAGGSETGYAYLGQALSSLRYFTVVVGHQESGLQALKRQIQGQGLRDGDLEPVALTVALDAVATKKRKRDMRKILSVDAQYCFF